jgi:hypothetical protein
MFRTILILGVFAVLGLFALKVIFGVFGVALGVLGWLLKWTWFLGIRILIVGLAVYVIIRIVSPETARKLRGR